MRHKRSTIRAVFQYPVFTAAGFECFLEIEADVEFGRDAELDEYGRPTECDTGDSIEILSAMFSGREVVKAFDVAAMPREMIEEIKEMAYEKAVEQIEEESEYYEYETIAAHY